MTTESTSSLSYRGKRDGMITETLLACTAILKAYTPAIFS